MNEQEIFWRGEFGNEYISRNNDKQFLNSNIKFFKKIKKYLNDSKTVFEVGCNIGLNLEAINKVRFSGKSKKLAKELINSL